jgi:hypothetical protein
MDARDLVFAYVAPETFLPLTSAIATAVGIFLMFGRLIFRSLARAGRLVRLRRKRVGVMNRPHFRTGKQGEKPLPRADRRRDRKREGAIDR